MPTSAGQPATTAVEPDSRQTETVVILDFGSQYSQLIARRVRECQVYCELVPHDAPSEQVERLRPRAFILSGGPASVYEPGAPLAPGYVFASGRPVLGICYGMQLIGHQLGGAVMPADRREYGHVDLAVDAAADLFHGLPGTFPVWMSHGDALTVLPPGFRALAHTTNSPFAAMGNGQGVVGLQFHPEVAHTPLGTQIIRNFLFRICRLRGDWTPGHFIAEAIERMRATIGTRRAICALSGGVDSSVAATLAHRAIGDQLTCVFVDNGLLRQGEAEQVVRTFGEQEHIQLVHVHARERFLRRLAGVEDPEQKRRIIGEEFIRVFEDEAAKLGRIDFLVQGTLYPDVIESTTAETKTANRIKTHHNVGGLPADVQFHIVEPLRYLFKDEVRAVGLELGLPEALVWRHPFPGPGLAVRVIGPVTEERLAVLRQADAIFIEELRAAGLHRQVAQALAVLTPLRSVGVMGDFRTYSNVVALRAVTTDDFMTADWARLPHDLLARVASRIVNEVPGVNRVVYDISTKPPATIEWE